MRPRPPPLARSRSRAQLADRAFSRAAGAEASHGNHVELLLDARENFPAWLAAIAAARHSIRFETYIIDDDPVGNAFVDALCERARAGVAVWCVFDWLGSLKAGALFTRLRDAGVHVGVFNPPHLASPLGWITRNHRKTISIDDRIAFVSGLCVSDKWNGDPGRNREPWRDTGIAVHGPAVADVAHAFDDVWHACEWGTHPPPPVPTTDAPGATQLRVIAGVPDHTGTYRLDLVIASMARRYLYLTDAYFVGTAAYVHALAAAAHDGVDVRLLVPGASDIPALRPLSRAGYRGLIQAGVRVFEWNGTMLHAKTAVADDLWSRIGSTNLNLASWMGNYELDVAVEDARFARRMADQYERDLANATEVVLTRRNRVRRVESTGVAPGPRRAYSGSAGRAAAGAASVGSVLGAALTNRRELGGGEAKLLGYMGVAGVAIAVFEFLWPAIIGWPLALILLWLGGSWIYKAGSLWLGSRGRPAAPDAPLDAASAPAGSAAPDAEPAGEASARASRTAVHD
ncbi:MAG: cardiolipin synthase B [Proteobacteria bacterium]|nr:cardiolipin synthase B [Pseudomonadota bacterium]